MYSKEDELIFIFGSRNSSPQEQVIIRSKSDIDEFAQSVADSFEDGMALSNWFNVHNSTRHGCYMESDFRPAYLAAFVLFVDRVWVIMTHLRAFQRDSSWCNVVLSFSFSYIFVVFFFSFFYICCYTRDAVFTPSAISRCRSTPRPSDNRSLRLFK